MDIKTSELTQDQENNEWYIFKNCSKHGPLTLNDINGLLIKNQITKDHHVWHAKYNNWMAIKDLSVFENVGFDVPSSKEKTLSAEASKVDLKPKSKVVYSRFEDNQGFWKKIMNLFSK
jgi:hypothetical protein